MQQRFDILSLALGEALSEAEGGEGEESSQLPQPLFFFIILIGVWRALEPNATNPPPAESYPHVRGIFPPRRQA